MANNFWQRLRLGFNTRKATVRLVATLGLIPCAHEMETMDNAFPCTQERPGNEASFTYESSELTCA